MLPTKRAVCSEARSWAFVRQNARTLAAWEDIALGGSAADRVVLAEDDPIVLANVCEPALVLEFLGDPLAIDGRHRVGPEAELLQRFGEVLASEATVDEELDGRAGRLRPTVRCCLCLPPVWASLGTATRTTSSTSGSGTPKSSAISASV